MPFMHGPMPLRRTYYYLRQGKIMFRHNVKVFMMNYHLKPSEQQRGAADFVFWHWAQLQYKNPTVQLVRRADFTPTPFAQAFLEDGREVLFDFEGTSRDDIVEVLQKTLGKSDLVLKRERLEKILLENPASFGSDCARQCACELQGQHPCTSLLLAPECLRGKWRWNHNLL
ncbi:hypothetical protein AB6A40_004201 [Gnathostoma spinigerum]|uniref:Small ribosomal subunit protein mS25 n=1 Tax=Gnathostoma spinigerum TaxID=75299 RepID=A0ABD6ELA4_9BILA